ncbi:tetratricopeptide repeat protein [Brachyspira pilosicoli]|uniref:tetratricopeptide repeat protein n=1 Tax=Brachyspira pilosicoli TaxID=52584 RepID=UPI003003ABAB
MSDNNTNTENTNNNTNNDNNNTKEKNKSNKKNIIIDFFKRHFSFMLYSIICIIFLLVLICKYSKYTNESKALIENSIKQFELNSQTQLSNYYEFLKETVTNESFESKEFIKNTLEEAFKPNIDLLRETLKDSKDFSINTVTFWLAFLSLIMIIFTILGIYANNKIMESNQRQSELIIEKTEFESNQTLKELNEKAKGIEETLKKIEQQTKQSEINVKKSKLSELLSRALNEQMNKNYDEAIKLYTKALEIDSKNLMALNNRGNLYSDKYKETKDEEYFDKALDDYNKILNTDKNNNDINTLNNRATLYSDKYKETKDEEYFNKSLEDYNKVLSIDKNHYPIYTNISFLYLICYQIKENKESLIQAGKYLNEGFKIHPNNLELINNYGIFLYLKYKENKIIDNLNNSEECLRKSVNNNRIKENVGESYYYLHLVYDEYAKLDNNINGYSKAECKNKSKEYLQKSRDLGYKHFMDK